MKANLHSLDMCVLVYFLHKELSLEECLIVQGIDYLQCFSGWINMLILSLAMLRAPFHIIHSKNSRGMVIFKCREIIVEKY